MARSVANRNRLHEISQSILNICRLDIPEDMDSMYVKLDISYRGRISYLIDLTKVGYREDKN